MIYFSKTFWIVKKFFYFCRVILNIYIMIFNSIGALGSFASDLVSGSISSLAQGAIGSIFNRSNADYSNRLAQRNAMFWANYNSPINQMQRLKEAGLNPALVYGNGSAATTFAGNSGAPDVHGVNLDFRTPAQMALLKAQRDNQLKQNALLDSQKQKVDAETTYQNLLNLELQSSDPARLGANRAAQSDADLQASLLRNQGLSYENDLKNMTNQIKSIESSFTKQFGFDVMKTDFDKKVLERNMLLWQNYFYPALQSASLRLTDAQISQLGSIVSLNAALKNKAEAETDNAKAAKFGIMSDSLSKYYEACMRKFGANPNSSLSNPFEVVNFMQKMFGLSSDAINSDFEKVFGVRPAPSGLGSPAPASGSASVSSHSFFNPATVAPSIDGAKSGNPIMPYHEKYVRSGSTREQRRKSVIKSYQNNNPYLVGFSPYMFFRKQ